MGVSLGVASSGVFVLASDVAVVPASVTAYGHLARNCNLVLKAKREGLALEYSWPLVG